MYRFWVSYLKKNAHPFLVFLLPSYLFTSIPLRSSPPPAFGCHFFLQDLSVLTGAELITEELGGKLEEIWTIDPSIRHFDPTISVKKNWVGSDEDMSPGFNNQPRIQRTKVQQDKPAAFNNQSDDSFPFWEMFPLFKGTFHWILGEWKKDVETLRALEANPKTQKGSRIDFGERKTWSPETFGRDFLWREFGVWYCQSLKCYTIHIYSLCVFGLYGRSWFRQRQPRGKSFSWASYLLQFGTCQRWH